MLIDASRLSAGLPPFEVAEPFPQFFAIRLGGRIPVSQETELKAAKFPEFKPSNTSKKLDLESDLIGIEWQVDLRDFLARSTYPSCYSRLTACQLGDPLVTSEFPLGFRLLTRKPSLHNEFG